MINGKILKSFAESNVLITGGTGLIGRQVADILCDSGAHVKIVSLDNIHVNDKAEHEYGDLREFSICMAITKGMDYVFHLAGIKGSAGITGNRLASHFVPTLMMNTNILEACRVNKVKKIAYTSSIGAYPNGSFFRESDYRQDSLPMDFAGWAKRMGELQIHAYNEQYGMDNFAIVRPSNVYGPGDNFDPDNAMVIPSLLYRIYRGDDPVIIQGDGTAIRDFAYSKDIAEGVILSLYHGTKSGFVNLGSGRRTSIRELVETLNGFIDFNYEFDVSGLPSFPERVMDITLARESIGYNPGTSLLDGLKKTWEWYINNTDEHLKKKNYFKEE